MRTERGPRHQVIANLGKAPGLDSPSRHGEEDTAALLEGRTPERQLDFDSDTKTPHRTQWTEVDVRGLRVERVRDFGQEYLALALWRRLGLRTLLADLMAPGKEGVEWELVACILTIARFCGNKSELEVAERWYADSALEGLLGVPWQRINDSRLYRGLDVLHEHKDAICAHLLKRYESWFGINFEFMLYDVTTVEVIVTMMEKKYGQARRIWVMDRGMVSEDNIDFLRARA